MNTDDNQSMESNDSLKEGVASLSQVSPKRNKKNAKNEKKKKSLTHFYWLGGGTLAVLWVWAMSSAHATKTEQKQTIATTVESDYSASLNANLARLKAMSEEKFAHDRVGIPLLASARFSSKEYVMRQNAPTSMYSAPFNESSHRYSSLSVQEATLAGQGVNERFGNYRSVTTTVEAQTISHPNFTIASGEFLHAVLETAINSDLPGMVRAVISQPAYSYTGERLIIPAGSRLMGQYSSTVIQGQNRVMIVWNRVILPDGIAVQLNSPGTDDLGRAGQGADSMNTHFFARFGESALLSLIGAGAATTGVNNQDQYNSAAQYRMAIAQSFQQSANQSLQGTVAMKPTLYIDQGATINVFVAHDLSFYHVLKNQVELPQPMPFFVKKSER